MGKSREHGLKVVRTWQAVLWETGIKAVVQVFVEELFKTKRSLFDREEMLKEYLAKRGSE